MHNHLNEPFSMKEMQTLPVKCTQFRYEYIICGTIILAFLILLNNVCTRLLCFCC